jgi:hypothetical protein
MSTITHRAALSLSCIRVLVSLRARGPQVYPAYLKKPCRWSAIRKLERLGLIEQRRWEKIEGLPLDYFFLTDAGLAKHDELLLPKEV